MRNIRLRAGMWIALLLVAAILVTACSGGDDPAADTADTSVTDTPTAEGTDTPAPPADTDPETEAETAPPVDLDSNGLKELLAAAIEKEVTDATIAFKTYMGNELYSENTISESGEDFQAESKSMGTTDRLTVVGDQVYYYVSMTDGTTVTEVRYALTVTAEQRAELYGFYVGEGSATGLDEDELTDGLLNSTMTGKRHADGHVELSCTGLDDSLAALLLGEAVQWSNLSFDFTLNAEGYITFMRFSVTMPAELTGDTAITLTSEVSLDYTVPAITAPADAADYADATYDELFGFQLPDIDPEEAASVGLPLDGDNYTVGGESPAVDPELQYLFLCLYGPYYADKTFTLYGNVMEDEYGNLLLSVGEDMDFVIYFDGIAEPTLGSYVVVSATFTQTVDMGDYVDFNCFTMMATSCETLGEAKGPNGGKLMYVTASSLNVRSTPDSSVNDNKVGLLSNGDMVEVLETGLGSNSNWCKIVFDCDQGYAYISMSYVSETKP